MYNGVPSRTTSTNDEGCLKAAYNWKAHHHTLPALRNRCVKGVEYAYSNVPITRADLKRGNKSGVKIDGESVLYAAVERRMRSVRGGPRGGLYTTDSVDYERSVVRARRHIEWIRGGMGGMQSVHVGAEWLGQHPECLDLEELVATARR